jgi:hypothetical protein
MNYLQLTHRSLRYSPPLPMGEGKGEGFQQ